MFTTFLQHYPVQKHELKNKNIKNEELAIFKIFCLNFFVYLRVIIIY
ncbi:protein of unknown function [Bartonella clarridgeiae 73]|uniref:Uncharacterized protein n=1 Tax=Bartonella clarridgeiae (strain CCUG 45776 / CIP 104772 / 73) TaxID=696125 RepID=E6YGP3_BARC7|nr:protein of unknown function [Bartonella clarridgeiae 73]